MIIFLIYQMGKCISQVNSSIAKGNKTKIKYDEIRKFYTITSTLIGEGVSSKVYKGIDSKGKIYAIKQIDKTIIRNHSLIRREIGLSLSLYHENIVHYHEAFESESEFNIVMDYIEGGDLFKYIVTSPKGKLSEEESSIIFFQIMKVLNYLHEKMGIIHRDIKPENFLVQKNLSSPIIKLIDFGFAIKAKDNKRSLYSFNGIKAGTDIYLAPEVLLGSTKKSYPNEKVDVWASGVVLLNMLSGSSPFSKDNPLFPFDKQITLGDIDYSFIRNERIKSLAEVLLERKPEFRPNSCQVLQQVTNIIQNLLIKNNASTSSFKQNLTAKTEDYSTHVY